MDIVTMQGRSRVYTRVHDRDKRFFSFPKRPDLPWGSPCLLYNAYCDYFPQVKRPGREVYHSVPSIAEFKTE